MKKTLSIILALIMALSMAVPAFAADSKITLGKKVTVSVKPDENKNLEFDVPEDGIYKVILTYVSGDGTFADVFYFDDYVNDGYVDSDKDFAEDEIVFTAEKDDEITITVYTFDNPSKVSVEVEKYNCEKLSLGKTSISADETDKYYIFTPDKDGYYNFRSDADSSKADPWVGVMEYGYVISENDDNGRCDDEFCDFNFDLSVYLYAGETYFVNFYNRSDEEGNYSGYDVTVSYNIKEKLEEFAVYGSWGEEDLIELPVGCEECIVIAAVPTGALPTSDVSITSSNENVVSIEGYDETAGTIFIYSNAAGRSTITVEIDGMTSEIDVRVYSDLELFFMNIFSNIGIFFQNIIAAIINILTGGVFSAF